VFAIAPGPSMGRSYRVDAAADRVVFQPASLPSAGQWLAEQTGPDGVVLAHTLSGNFLAGVTPGRAYVGHWVATLDFVRKQREMAWFYQSPFDDQHRQFLADRHISFVVYGPHERAIGAVPPTDEARAGGPAEAHIGPCPATVCLDSVYDHDGVQVFAVRHGSSWQAVESHPSITPSRSIAGHRYPD
jgi:hypothetical protein